VLADTPREARVRLAGRLFRSPFQIEPTMVARDGASALTLNERVTNEGAEPLAAMRSYHPCLGAPCLGPDCLLDSGTRTVWAEPTYDTPRAPSRASARGHAWLWQELRGSRGFPWYGAPYTMAVESASNVPGLGLNRVLEGTGTHLILVAGESRAFTLRAIFYDVDASTGVVE